MPRQAPMRVTDENRASGGYFTAHRINAGLQFTGAPQPHYPRVELSDLDKKISSERLKTGQGRDIRRLPEEIDTVDKRISKTRTGPPWQSSVTGKRGPDPVAERDR